MSLSTDSIQMMKMAIFLSLIFLHVVCRERKGLEDLGFGYCHTNGMGYIGNNVTARLCVLDQHNR